MRPRKKNFFSPVLSDKTHYIEAQLIDKVTLWALRVILKLGGSKVYFDQRGNVTDETLASFLDLGHYTQSDIQESDLKEPIELLYEKLEKLESKTKFGTLPILEKNIGCSSTISFFRHPPLKLA